jgi:hypothetical protein
MTTVAEHFGVMVHPNCTTREFRCGVELEIEQIQEPISNTTTWSCKTDHSLRDGGIEIVTVPMSFENTLKAFQEIHGKLALGPTPFGERTSIHVHINCLNLTLKEVKELVLLYALLEPLYFNFVGKQRENNIFCVPLNYTHLPSQYKTDIGGLHKIWHKYTAFNLCPLGNGKEGSEGLGTIEFRHMYGTKDVTLFKTWLSSIKELYDFVEKNKDFSLLDTLEVGVDIATLAKEVVPSLANAHSSLVLREMCKDTVLDVKLASGGLR